MSPLAEFGLSAQPDLDLVTGVVSGLVDQQLSNDPGGDRWVRLLDPALDMLTAHFTNRHTDQSAVRADRKPRSQRTRKE